MPVKGDEFSQFHAPQRLSTVVQMINSNNIFLNLLTQASASTDSMKYRLFRETSEDATVGARALNSNFQEGTTSFAPEDFHLAFYGGTMDVDKKFEEYDGSEAQITQQLAAKMKSLGIKMTEDLIKGNSSTTVNGFDGLYRQLTKANNYFIGDGPVELVDTANTTDAAKREKAVAFGVDNNPVGVAMTSAANRLLLLESMDRAISRCVEKPDIVLMGGGVRRILKSAMREENMITAPIQQFGMNVDTFDGIPIVEIVKKADSTPIMGFDELTPDGTTSNEAASMLFIKFGFGQYYGAITGKEPALSEPEVNGQIRTWTVERDMQHILFHLASAIRIGGILR